ncbi:MAG: hypothetical protein MPK13_05720, partial [Gammaproteobacteria bacterium]|nr:hypothetical protein [Gammaproteobacteria bacterium]
MKTSPTDLAFLHGGNMAYLESLYRDGGSGNGAWREVFSALDNGGGIPAAAKSPGKTAGAAKPSIHKQAQVSRLISAYRALGHLA